MKTVNGNLITLSQAGEFDLIVHGCNCHCRMGSGIAKAIRATFPKAWEADRQTTPGDRSKLGTCTSGVGKASHAMGTAIGDVNAYSQFDFRLIKRDFSGKRIGYPLIGAGLADGDWSVIEKIIDEELSGEDHTLVVFDAS